MSNNEWKPGIQLLTGIDDEYISEVLSSTKRKGSTLKWLYVAAACFVALVSVAAITIFVKKPNDDISALVPITPSHNTDVEKTASPKDSSLPDETSTPAITAEPTDYYPVTTAGPTDGADTPRETYSSAVLPTTQGEYTPNPTNTGAPTATPKPTTTPTATPKPTTAPTATPKPTPTPAPGPYPSSHYFYSEEAFIKAVLSGDEYYSAINWVTHYFIPHNIPSNCSFFCISANSSDVGLRYECNSSGTLKSFNFVWCSKKDPNEVETDAYAFCYDGSPYNVEEYHGHYIIRDPNWYIWEVYWAQDGQVFHAKFWDGFSYELVDTVCDACLIPVK